MLFSFLSFSIISTALANDTWTNIATGIDYLHRVETTPRAQDIYAAKIDLTNPLISLHASANISGVERTVTTKTFALNTGAIVAINGDWGTTTTPISLSISDGDMWNPHFSDPSVASYWGYFACDIFNNCDASIANVSAPDFQYPMLQPYRYFNAVGSNGIMLVNDGVRASGCYDTIRNPRSAICLNQARTELWFIAVDGRRSAAAGMTCDEMRDLVLDLGCWDASMQDGGGSTNLVVDGVVKNQPSDGSPRVNVNHIGVMLANSVDPQCNVSSGRWCTGTTLNTCSGGRFIASGDCATYGATCEEDGDWAYCVHYLCPNGEGQGAECTSETGISYCNDGWPQDGDCGALGLKCGTDSYGSACMQAECQSGPNSGFCIDSFTAAQCTDGIYNQTTCTDGSFCVVENGISSCFTVETEDSGISEPASQPSANPSWEPSGQPTSEPSEPSDTAESDTTPAKTGCQVILSPSLPFGIAIVVLGLGMRRRKKGSR